MEVSNIVIKLVNNVAADYEDDLAIQRQLIMNLTESDFSCAGLETKIAILEKEFDDLSFKMVQILLEKKEFFLKQTENIIKISELLQYALWRCRKAKFCLVNAKKQLTSMILGMLAAQRKKLILHELLKSIKILKIMKSTTSDLKNYLEVHNYSGAILFLLERQKFSCKFVKYNCIESLHCKLGEKLLITEIELENILSQIIHNFDAEKYKDLLTAYKILNKLPNALDQLQIKYVCLLHSTIVASVQIVVFGQVQEECELTFEELCEKIIPEKYVSCFLFICNSIWFILVSQYQIYHWHKNESQWTESHFQHYNNNLIEDLQKGKIRIWCDIESKICIYLSSSVFKDIKFEQFVQLISISKHLKKIGTEFCGENSKKLTCYILERSRNFLKNFEKICFNEICLFLHHESWVPVDSFYNIFMLHEFRTLKSFITKYCTIFNKMSFDSNIIESLPKKDIQNLQHPNKSSTNELYGYFNKFIEKNSPFEGILELSTLEEDMLCVTCEEKYINNEMIQGTNMILLEIKKLIITNTTLNIFRYLGRYLHVCVLLPTLSSILVPSIVDLVDFYMCSVHYIFARETPTFVKKCFEERLAQKFKYYREHQAFGIDVWPSILFSKECQDLCDLHIPFGLAQRIIAAESIVFLMEELAKLRPCLHHFLSAAQLKYFEEHCCNIEYKSEICELILMSTIAKMTDCSRILTEMENVNWNISHVNTQHSSYVDKITRSIQNFSMRLEELPKTFCISYEVIWKSCHRFFSSLLIEGFSNVKKCSPGGRALMLLDFTHFVTILELISGFKFQKYKNIVDAYIKAFYYPPEIFEVWVLEQNSKQNYFTKQLKALVCMVPDKKTRQKLLTILEVD